MKGSDFPSDILSGAFTIFVNEMEKHLSETRVIFSHESLPTVPELQDARNRFHKIKGGAGFFGLEDIEETASKIENILKEVKTSEESAVDAINDLIKTLEKHLAQVPHLVSNPG